MSNKLILILLIAGIVPVIFYCIFDLWLLPWFAKRAADKIIREIGSGKPPKPRDYNFKIVLDSNGFTVASVKKPDEKPTTIEWKKIRRVTAFKRDLYTVDCICLIFETSKETGVELDEDMKGWPELLEALPDHLPGCKSLAEWIFTVGSPAFAPNPTEIYSDLSNSGSIQPLQDQSP